MRRTLFTLVLFLPALAMAGPSQVVEIPAERDATLIESADGARANGSGPSLFVGRTSQPVDSRRRALLRFDVAGAIPKRATVVSVRLRMQVNPSNAQEVVARLHRVLRPWSEGPSSASGGSGQASLPGDVTWIHTDYPARRWPRDGGLFVPRASGVAPLPGAGGFEVAGPALTRDVQRWLRAPRTNHGWILIGDESIPQSSRNLASRESADADARPVLEVRYRLRR